MTLAGAAKRLRQNREGVSRDLEIIEKLQRVRSLLLDVREVLKADDDGREVFVDPAPADWDDTPVLEYGAGSDGEPAGSRLPGESSPGAETIGDRARSVTDTAFRHEADDPTSGSGEGQGTVLMREPHCAEVPEGLAELVAVATDNGCEAGPAAPGLTDGEPFESEIVVGHRLAIEAERYEKSPQRQNNRGRASALPLSNIDRKNYFTY